MTVYEALFNQIDKIQAAAIAGIKTDNGYETLVDIIDSASNLKNCLKRNFNVLQAEAEAE